MTGSARRRLAPRAAAGVLLAAMMLIVPFAGQPGPEVVGFVPAWFAAVFVCDLGTALLLLGLYRHGGGLRLAVLGAAYLWSATVTALMALAAPGIVHAQPALGGLDSLAWLWVARHVGPVVLIAVALAPWSPGWERTVSTPRRVGACVLGLIAAGPGVLTVVMLAAPQILPALADPTTWRLHTEVLVAVLAVTAIAVAVATIGVAQRESSSGLEAWALVAAVAWLGDTGFMAWHDEPGTISYYAARLLGIVAAFVLMGAVLRELWHEHREAVAAAAGIERRMERLVEDQRLREHVAAVVSHDLRAPLVGLLGYQRILAEDPDLDPAVVHRMHQRSLLLTRRLSLLAEDLLAATTSEHVELTVEPRVIDLGEQLAESASSFPHLDLQLVCPRGARVYADPLRLQQILTNLISNAERHGAAPVVVEVEPGPSDDEVTIKVSDAGEAVPPTFVPQVLERYEQPPGVTYRGQGLGLSVVHELVRRHGGTVRYDLTAPAFIVTLPSRPTAPAELLDEQMTSA